MSEMDYERGSRAAWTLILQQALMHLDYEASKASGARWILEREAAIAALRDICQVHGDNDWPDNLHLADIIEKHLGRNLDDRAPDRDSV
jgi:hypothetical protein